MTSRERMKAIEEVTCAFFKLLVDPTPKTIAMFVICQDEAMQRFSNTSKSLTFYEHFSIVLNVHNELGLWEDLRAIVKEE